MTPKKLNNIKNPGFKAPEGYFEDLSDKVLAKLNKEPSDTLPETNGFGVPEGYFSEVSETIMDRVDTKHTNKVKLLSLRKRAFYISGIAAALLILFAILPLNTSEEVVTMDMVELYFEDKDIDSYELAELLVETELLSVDDLIIEPEYDDDELETYLLENADLEQIIVQ